MTIGRADELAMAMVGVQYYLLKHVHPAALLGYMAVVEGDPSPIDTVALLENLHGKRLLRFVRFHALKDLLHRRELFDLIDAAPGPLRELIAYSAEVTLDHFTRAVSTWS